MGYLDETSNEAVGSLQEFLAKKLAKKDGPAAHANRPSVLAKMTDDDLDIDVTPSTITYDDLFYIGDPDLANYDPKKGIAKGPQYDPRTSLGGIFPSIQATPSDVTDFLIKMFPRLGEERELLEKKIVALQQEAIRYDADLQARMAKIVARLHEFGALKHWKNYDSEEQMVKEIASLQNLTIDRWGIAAQQMSHIRAIRGRHLPSYERPIITSVVEAIEQLIEVVDRNGGSLTPEGENDQIDYARFVATYKVDELEKVFLRERLQSAHIRTMKEFIQDPETMFGRNPFPNWESHPTLLAYADLETKKKFAEMEKVWDANRIRFPKLFHDWYGEVKRLEKEGDPEEFYIPQPDGSKTLNLEAVRAHFQDLLDKTDKEHGIDWRPTSPALSEETRQLFEKDLGFRRFVGPDISDDFLRDLMMTPERFHEQLEYYRDHIFKLSLLKVQRGGGSKGVRDAEFANQDPADFLPQSQAAGEGEEGERAEGEGDEGAEDADVPVSLEEREWRREVVDGEEVIADPEYYRLRELELLEARGQEIKDLEALRNWARKRDEGDDDGEEGEEGEDAGFRSRGDADLDDFWGDSDEGNVDLLSHYSNPDLEAFIAEEDDDGEAREFLQSAFRRRQQKPSSDVHPDFDYLGGIYWNDQNERERAALRNTEGVKLEPEERQFEGEKEFYYDYNKRPGRLMRRMIADSGFKDTTKERGCIYCKLDNPPPLNPWNVEWLAALVDRAGDIAPRYETEFCRSHQRRIKKVFKRAVNLGFFSYRKGEFTKINPFRAPPWKRVNNHATPPEMFRKLLLSDDPDLWEHLEEVVDQVAEMDENEAYSDEEMLEIELTMRRPMGKPSDPRPRNLAPQN